MSSVRPQRRIALLSAAAAVVAAVATTAGGSTATAAPALGPTFVDNFDGTKVDTTRWTVGDTATNWNGIGTGRCHKAENVWVADGILHLRSTVTPQSFTCSYPNGETFQTTGSSAEINSKGKFRQTYGSWEVRAKFAAEASHAASSIWLYPEKETYGAWPRSGEVDIVERMPWSNQAAYNSVHYLDSSKGTSFSASDGDGNPGETRACATDITQWHVYGVKWDRRQMTFTVDGTVCSTMGWAPSNVRAPAPFDQPFFTILRQAAVLESTSVTVTRDMLVDWVKVTA